MSATWTVNFTSPTDFTGAVLDPNDFRQTDETVFSTSYDGLFAGGYSTRIQYGHHRRNLESFTLEDGIVDFLDSTFEDPGKQELSGLAERTFN